MERMALTKVMRKAKKPKTLLFSRCKLFISILSMLLSTCTSSCETASSCACMKAFSCMSPNTETAIVWLDGGDGEIVRGHGWWATTVQEKSEGRTGLLLMTKLLSLVRDNNKRTMRVSVVRYRCCT